MIVNKQIHKDFIDQEESITSIVSNYDTEGTPFGNQERNSLKLFNLSGLTVNVKSFRVPNAINKTAYRFFRKSKAQRSFEYANKLQQLGIGTPKPIAFYEFLKPLSFYKSYYLSEQLECDLTFRELNHDLKYPNHKEILQAFARFTFELHEKGINFLDHSPGNTLIKKIDNHYNFYLVDLNRMEFKTLDFDARMKNFNRLTPYKAIIEVLSEEYAKHSGDTKEIVFNAMWKHTQTFQERYKRRRKIKDKLKFW